MVVFFPIILSSLHHCLLFIGIRFDAATQIANDQFLAIVTEQSHQQARDR